MRKFTILISLVLLASGSLFAQWPASFGPDAYGYSAQTFDSNDARYQWVDISTRGIEIAGLADDNAIGPFNLGFGFQFYWNAETELCVGSNGFIQFGSACENIASAPTQGFPTMPTADLLDDVVAPFLSDLSFAGATNTAKAYFYTNQTDSAIITFENVPFWIDAPIAFGGSNTFQVILNGADSTIKFLYQTQTGSWDPTYDNTTAPAVIGIENISGTIGLGINASVTNISDLRPVSGTGIVFTAPAVALINIPDVEPQGVQNERSAGFFLPEGATDYEFFTTLANVGNVDMTSTTDAYLELTDQAANVLWNDTIYNMPGLQVSQSSQHTFPLKFNFFAVNAPSTQTTYGVSVEVNNADDLNFGNNVVSVEAVAVDTTGGKALFAFTEIKDANDMTATVLWSGGGGNEGAGFYYKPYGYPTVIEAVDVFLFPNLFGNTPTLADTVAGGDIRVAVYEEDSNGRQGNLIWEKILPKTDIDLAHDDGAGGIILGEWNRIALDPSDYITVDSGGVYVAWFHYNDSVILGGQNTAPISRQFYEILGGAWALHRNGNTEDYAISVYADISNAVMDTVANPPNAIDPDVIGLNTFNVFPNPTTGLLNIELAWDQPTAAMIKVMDLQGNKVHLDMTRATSSYKKTMDVSQLAKGIYLIQVSTNAGQQTRKLVVQ